MAQRPKPTKQLLIELCGGNQGLISSVHHGLCETPLADFYPNLDLDEIVAFAASSWNTKDNYPSFFLDFMLRESGDVYDIFSEVYKIGFPWLNKHKNISDKLKTKHKKLNPFEGRDLRARLQEVPPLTVSRLKRDLMEGANEYVFECQYTDRKRERRGDNYKLFVMAFQPVYPRAGKIVPAYASEVAKILSHYPRGYQEK